MLFAIIDHHIGLFIDYISLDIYIYIFKKIPDKVGLELAQP